MPTNPMRLKHIRAMPSPRSSEPGRREAPGVPRYERSDYCQHNDPSRHYLGKMTDKKRQNAKDILKREEVHTNREKLIQIICQKLFNKFRRLPKGEIQKVVRKFVSTKSQINADDLAELENVIRNYMKAKKGGTHSGANLPDVNSNTENNNKEGNIFNGKSNGKDGPCTCLGCSSGSPCVVLPKGREWEALNLFQSYQSVIQEKKDLEDFKRKQQELRAALDRQVLEAKQRHELEKNEDREYLRYINQDLKKHNDENATKLEKQNAQHARERKFWEKQISDDIAARQKEKEQLLREEQRDLQRMQKIVNEEKWKIQQKKEREAEINRTILEENARNKLLNQDRILKEKDEDNRVMEEYANRLDAEEKRRQDAFAKRMNDLEKIVKLADDGPVGKGRRDVEKREEELLLKQQLAKDQADALRERNDLLAKAERDRIMAADNKAILEEQAEARRNAKDNDKFYSERFKRQGREYEEEVNRKKQAEVEKCLAQRRALQAQMDAKRQEYENMNRVERSLNCDAINSIREDTTFQGRLQHRVRMAKGSRPSTPGSARDPPKSRKNGWM